MQNEETRGQKMMVKREEGLGKFFGGSLFWEAGRVLRREGIRMAGGGGRDDGFAPD